LDLEAGAELELFFLTGEFELELEDKEGNSSFDSLLIEKPFALGSNKLLRFETSGLTETDLPVTLVVLVVGGKGKIVVCG